MIARHKPQIVPLECDLHAHSLAGHDEIVAVDLAFLGRVVLVLNTVDLQAIQVVTIFGLHADLHRLPRGNGRNVHLAFLIQPGFAVILAIVVELVDRQLYRILIALRKCGRCHGEDHDQYQKSRDKPLHFH